MNKYLISKRQSGKTTNMIKNLRPNDIVVVYSTSEKKRIEEQIYLNRGTSFSQDFKGRVFTAISYIKTVGFGRVGTLYIDEFSLVSSNPDFMRKLYVSNKSYDNLVALDFESISLDIEKIRIIKKLMSIYKSSDKFIHLLNQDYRPYYEEIISRGIYIFDEIEVLNKYAI